jgi:protein phosphatase
MTNPGLEVHAASDRGRRRERNEDSHGIWSAAGRDGRGWLLVVADGMGGMQAGDVASRMAVESVVRAYSTCDADIVPLEALRQAVEAANRDVHEVGRTRADCVGMGTTCTAAVVRDGRIWVAHVGDSRAYLVHEGGAVRLTEDHSLVAALVRHQVLTPEQARDDARRHLVTRGVGLHATVEVDVARIDMRLEPGTTLLLCSDGLHGLVSDRELAALTAGRPLESACSALIELANQRGGPDNITVVVARLEAAA